MKLRAIISTLLCIALLAVMALAAADPAPPAGMEGMGALPDGMGAPPDGMGMPDGMGAPPDGMGAPGGMGGGGSAYGSVDSNSPTAALIIDDGAISSGADFSGTMETAAAPDASGVSGLRITGSGSDNGLVIRQTQGAELTLGGSESVYDVDGDGAPDYNSVIDLTGVAEDVDGEGHAATAVLVDAADGSGLLTIDNTLLKTSGYRAPGLLSTSTDFGVAIKNSRIEALGGAASFMPNFKLLVGSTRATCLMSQNTWLYNTVISAKDWGAVSLDTTPDADVYMAASYGEARLGGYGLYAVNGTRTHMYGSGLVAAQYGMFLMGNGVVTMDALSAADEVALLHAGESLAGLDPAEGSLAAGSINAVVVHVNSGVGAAGLKYPATLSIKNTVLSTMPEDVVSRLGSEISFEDYDSYLLAPIKDQGASWFYLKHCEGSLIAARSAGVTVTVGEGCRLSAENGVLLHSIIGYDSDAGNIYNDSSLQNADVISPITLNIDAPTQGDVLHEDYQRRLTLNLNADYTGAVYSGTQDDWNALWSDASLEDALESAGFSAADFSVADNGEAIRGWLIRETGEYPAVYGAEVSVGAGAVWNVTGTSRLSALTVAEGGSVSIPDGFRLYVGCGSDYSLAGAAELQAVEPGVRYEMVVIAKDTGFTDVAAEDWFCADVERLAALGVINGNPGARFAPCDALTYAQAAKLAAVLYSSRTGEMLAEADCDPWYAGYAQYVQSAGLLPADTVFDAPIAPVDAAKLFSKALDKPLAGGAYGGAVLSRAEAAALIVRLMDGV